MMRNRIYSIALILVLALSCSSCGKRQPPQEEETATSVSSEVKEQVAEKNENYLIKKETTWDNNELSMETEYVYDDEEKLSCKIMRIYMASNVVNELEKYGAPYVNPAVITSKYEYDGINRVEKMTTSSVNISGEMSHYTDEYTYDSSGGYEIKSYYDDGRLSETYSFDASGKMLEHTMYAGSNYYTDTYWYYDNGEIETVVTNSYKNNGEHIRTSSVVYEYEYENGRKIKQVNSKDSNYVLYMYDANENLFEEKTLGVNGTLKTRKQYEYIEKNLLKNSEVEFSDDERVSHERIQGCWYFMNKEYYSCEIINIEANKILGVTYPGESWGSGEIKSIKKNADESFSLTIYYPETYQYEELVPAHETIIKFSSNDNYENTLTVMYENGYTETYNYGGNYDECIKLCERMLEDRTVNNSGGNEFEENNLMGNNVVKGEGVFTGVVCEGRGFYYLQLEKDISYYDYGSQCVITDSVIWLPDCYSDYFTNYLSDELTLKGTLFDYRGGGTLMFNECCDIVNVNNGEILKGSLN